MTLWKFFKTMGTAGAPNFYFILPPPKAAANGRLWRPKRRAKGATPPKGEGNPAEDGYFASFNKEDSQVICCATFC